MDWGRFFDDTRKAAGVDSFSKLAPLLHVTDGAISHYRTGKRIPSAWTVAAALKLQGHADAEREAARIMREAAKSAEERAFWRKLGAAAAVAIVALFPLHEASATATLTDGPVMHYAKLRSAMIRAARGLHRALSRLKDAGRGLNAPALLA